MALLAGLCVLALTLAGARAEPVAPAREAFGSWLATCRPDGYCEATSKQGAGPPETATDMSFRIGRHAQQTWWEMSITTPTAAPDGVSPLTVTVDGKPIVFVPPDDVAAYGTPTDFFLTGRKAQLLMDRLMPGKTVGFGFTDAKGTPHSAQFALEGLTAALVWIDTRQHRIGSERVAEVPPYGLQPMPAASPPDTMPARACLIRHGETCIRPAAPDPASESGLN